MAMIRRNTCALILLFVAHVFEFVQAYHIVSDDTLRSLRRPTSYEFDINTGSVLSPILIPRVPGSEGSAKVLQHFDSYFREFLPAWRIEYQNSSWTTPTSDGAEIPMRNFIASRDPPWAAEGDTGRLTLVAHYDSKAQPEGFIGAVDSAAPCAMMMHAVTWIDSALTSKWDLMQSSGTETLDEHQGIQIIFLDGEEAFKSWTATDSVYGARSLAEEWDNTVHAAQSTYKTRLESISLFVLLDLLGASNPSIPSYFKTTHWAYQKIANLESRLRGLNLFKSKPPGNNNPTPDTKAHWFPDGDKDAHNPATNFPSWQMQDDHIPFMARGVSVLHVIPSRFPPVWHTINDDGEHLDMDTVEDWAVLTMGFIAEWMELEGFMPIERDPGKEKEKVKRDNDRDGGGILEGRVHGPKGQLPEEHARNNVWKEKQKDRERPISKTEL